MADTVSGISALSRIAFPSYEVDRRSTRTTAPHGMTGPEIRRLTNAAWFMAQNCRASKSSLWWATTSKGTSRSIIAEIWKRITRLQGAHALPAYSALVFETRGGLHAHIIFAGNPEVADRLNRAAFGHTIQVDRVTDPNDLARKYLSKERTPQASYGRSHMLGGRLKGSHRLAGSGDRVRLSRQLERDALSAGAVEPWQHSNAKRSAERKPYRLRKLSSRKALRLAGQLSLLPEIECPVSRLRDFAGGFVPRSVAREIEFLRGQHGWTQTELGLKIARGQPHLSNALRGHDPISRYATSRLRELLLGGSSI
jgi:hypothetical protein